MNKFLLALPFIIIAVVFLASENRYEPLKQYDLYKPTVERIHVLNPSVKVKATYYNPDKGQTDSSPFITACNYRIDPDDPDKHRYVALSRDLIRPTEWHSEESGYNPDAPFAFGDTIFVEGSEVFDGFWIVADSMNKRYENRIDFLVDDRYIGFDSHSEVEITKL